MLIRRTTVSLSNGLLVLGVIHPNKPDCVLHKGFVSVNEAAFQRTPGEFLCHLAVYTFSALIASRFLAFRVVLVLRIGPLRET